MKVVNLTPHTIMLTTETGAVNIPASGIVARCEVSSEHWGTVEVQGVSVPLVKTSFGAVKDLPDPVPGTVYLVSGVVLSALAGSRPDVVGVTNLVRDDAGRVIAAQAFSC